MSETNKSVIDRLVVKLAQYIESKYSLKGIIFVYGLATLLNKGLFTQEEMELLVAEGTDEELQGILDFSGITEILETDFKSLLPIPGTNDLLILTFEEKELAQVAINILVYNFGLKWVSGGTISIGRELWPASIDEMPADMRGRAFFINPFIQMSYSERGYAYTSKEERDRKGLKTTIVEFKPEGVTYE